MFGFSNLFTNNQYWFLTCNVFTNSRLFPPDYDITTNYPIPGKYYYINHLGGFEGMRQKFWTLITICIIRLTSDELSLNINIICQGDNQIVLIKYKPNQIKRQSEIQNLFLSTLDYNFGQVNLNLKLEETWYLKRLFEYGKIRYLEGVSISQGTKKAARLIPDINDGLASFHSGLNTINTITESIAKGDIDPDREFYVNQVSTLNYLQRKKVFSDKHNHSDMLSLLFHPSDFGGLSLSTYFSLILRGFDDEPTHWMSLFLTVKEENLKLFVRILTINKFEKKTGQYYCTI